MYSPLCVARPVYHESGKAWLNKQVAALPRGQGELVVPDLKVELFAMVAVTVADWALYSSPAQLIVGDVMAQPRGAPETR
jgi:hypothetical protein